MEKRLINYEDLTRSEKIDHIWEYYKFHIIASGFALFCVFWILNHYVFNPPPETTLDVSIFGMYAQTEVVEELQIALDGIIVKDGENEESIVDFFSIDEAQDYQMKQASVTKMMAKASLHDYDIMIFEGDFFQNYLQEDSLLALNELVDKGFIKVEPSLLKKGSDFDLPDDNIYLVDISDHEGFTRMLTTDNNIYLGIFSVYEDIEHVEEALDYIINEFK